MARRQIYGGREADEFRSRRDIIDEIIADNEIAEGKELKELRDILQEFFENSNPTTKDKLDKYIRGLLDAGWSRKRLESLMTRASARISIEKKQEKVVSPRAQRRQARKQANPSK